MHECDVAIVGAGAAGIAAARRIAAAGLNPMLLEGSNRIGGRAWTQVVEGIPLDLGCGWLHSADRNPWTALAPELGFTVDRTPPPWRRQAGGIGFPPNDQRAARKAYAAFDERIRASPPSSDRASDALPAKSRWSVYINTLSGYINGVDLDALSIADYIAYDDADSGENWRVVEGYGALIERAAGNLMVVRGCPVSRIDDLGPRLRLTTPKGVFEARAAIVTASTEILASGAIALPAALAPAMDAASRLPLGLADKLVLRLEDEALDLPDGQLLGDPGARRTGSYHIRPLGRPIIECFFGGGCAEALDREGEAAMANFALDELAKLFGASIRPRLRPIAATRWRREPFIGGSYSHALPGESGARAELAMRRHDRILLAGEACSAQDFSTAHGAHETGTAAAEAIITDLGRK